MGIKNPRNYLYLNSTTDDAMARSSIEIDKGNTYLSICDVGVQRLG